MATKSDKNHKSPSLEISAPNLLDFAS